jgi:hypothetical protein
MTSVWPIPTGYEPDQEATMYEEDTIGYHLRQVSKLIRYSIDNPWHRALIWIWITPRLLIFLFRHAIGL